MSNNAILRRAESLKIKPTCVYHRRMPFLAILFALTCGLGSTALAQPPIETPQRVELKEAMQWMYTATYLPHRDEILVTDPKAGSIRIFGEDGDVLNQAMTPGLKGRIVPAPPAFSGLGSSYVAVSDDGLQGLNGHFRKQGAPVKLGPGSSPGRGGASVAHYDIQLTDSGWIVGFGSVRANHNSSTPVFGFFTQSVAEMGGPDDSVRLVHPLSASELYYRLANSYITTIGSDFYFIALEKTPRLYRVELDDEEPVAQSLRGFPSENTFIVPSFNDRDYGYRPIRVFNALENLPGGLPTGLTSQKGKLFALYSPKGSSDFWELIALKPKPDRVEVTGRFCIKSDATHLTMAPGHRHWAIFERDSAKKDADSEKVSQEIASFIRIETDTLQEEVPEESLRTSCGPGYLDSSRPASTLARR